MIYSAEYRLPEFYKRAPELRKSFETRFDYSSAKTAAPFVWDYWHVEGKYTLLRTPAYLFFPKKIYEDFHNQLVWWGRQTLGCHDITPTWLSCYVESCEQKIHVDLPHGPWAFVYSLTAWNSRKFTGGETLIKSNKAFARVPTKFNQLLVFDPRRPHGVSRVSGVNDVKQGRLVIHGWFVNPRPFIQGPISTKELANQILALDEFIFKNSDLVSGITGTASFQISIATSGKIKSVVPLASTLRSDLRNISDGAQSVSLMIEKIKQLITKNFSFKKQQKPTLITLPLIFE
ncbi:MAG: 2OG-Fe(II) oxygenase [Pseudomonadota bacterium]|nr:2OG-Fe(II) oxygenase [Pseudomonadota bacterium]